MKQGFPPLEPAVKAALFSIWKFWFAVMLNFTLLIALFRSIKFIFNHPYGSYVLRLQSCKNSAEYIDPLGYGDLVKVWRKWLLLLIWIVGSFMILSLLFTWIFTSFNSLFDWFGIWLLYGFILIAGFFSFILLGSRCKAVRIVKC
jgi:hypothetical protein